MEAGNPSGCVLYTCLYPITWHSNHIPIIPFMDVGKSRLQTYIMQIEPYIHEYTSMPNYCEAHLMGLK